MLGMLEKSGDKMGIRWRRMEKDGAHGPNTRHQTPDFTEEAPEVLCRSHRLTVSHETEHVACRNQWGCYDESQEIGIVLSTTIAIVIPD